MVDELMENYDVKYYGIDLEADNTSIYLNGNATIVASVVSNELDTFVVELNPDYTVDSVQIDGVRLSHIIQGDEIKVRLTPSFAQETLFEATVFYHGSLSAGSQGFFSGISHDDSHNITYTLSEPLYAKDWFPCKQVLTDKADSVAVFVTTDSTLKAGSNGLLINTVNLGDGRVRYEWKSKYPIAYYLISMTIGDYVEYNIYAKPEGIEDSILIQNYLYNSDILAYYKDDIDMTSVMIEAYSDMFGMYPFKDEKYGHCMAAIGGGMEHQTMTTLSSLDFELVAHELAHMWFGDFVTCGTWQDIWINEGFATYGNLLALEYIKGQFPVDEMLGYHYDQFASAASGSIYIPDSDFDIDYSNTSSVASLSNRIFDWYLSYEKGAVILHMIRYELQDDDMFFQVLKTYLEAYQNGNAIGLDFKSVLENESGKDFTAFFNQWYFGEGFPRYKITWNQVDGNVRIQSKQGKSTPAAPFFRMNMDYRLSFAGGDTIIRLEQTEPTQLFEIPFSESVTALEVDPNHWVLAQITSIINGEITEIPNQITTGDIHIFPNPFSDRLTISNARNGVPATINIYNSLGQYIASVTTQTEPTVIQTDLFPKGVYFVKIKTNTEMWTQKIVKN